ncbi:MAG: PD40 domain-containing protein, partial [Deltaproteobacteria bacterium]|nr:PD40 domain-containing protein [Deltaproteobacteria bacterium]
GRLRSSLFDMLLRSHALEGKLLRLDQISSNTRIYPRGHVPYVYGAFFLNYIADRYGDDVLTRISHGYGGTPLPYALNRVVKHVVGKTYETLYGEFLDQVKRRYALEATLVRARGLTPFVRLTCHGWSAGSPRYVRGGKELVYLDMDGKSHPSIRVIDTAAIEGGHLRVVESHPNLGAATVGFSPDGRNLVYERGVMWRTFHSYHDIYMRRRKDGYVRRITYGLRARDPEVSPRGSHMVFVTNELGRNNLATIPLSGGKVRILYRGRQGEQIFRPRFSPDGRSLVFSMWRAGGKRDIVLFDLAGKRIRLLTNDRAIDQDPVFSSNGSRVYFSSDRTGIFNVYCMDVATRRLRQVTNVLGGAFEPAISPDEDRLVYVGFGARGYDLHTMRLDRRRFMPVLPFIGTHPSGTRRVGGRGMVERRARRETLASPPPRSYPVSAYNPLKTVYPHSWHATMGTDQFGMSLGLDVMGADVIDRHRYRAAVNVSTAKGYVSYLGIYSYTRFWPSIQIDTSHYVGARGGKVIDGRNHNYIEDNYGAGLSLGLPVLRIPEHAVTVNLGYRFNYFRDVDGGKVVVFPGMVSPRLPEVGILSGAAVSISYSSIQRYAESTSNSGGRKIGISIRVDDRSLGSDFKSTQITWGWTEYIELPWLHDHVLALRYGGGVARGDFKRRGFFFVGGFPEQDLIDAVINQLPIGGAFLRGYSPGTFYGDQYHLLNVEYRMPLYDIERGLSSLPLYFNHIHAAVFADVGHAFFGPLAFDALKVGVGGEVLVEFVLGYFVPLTLRVGFARGVMAEGSNEFFALLGRRF